MKKRNLLLVMLAIMLVFGMIVACGEEPEEEGPDLEAEETYFGTYTTTYTTGGGTTIVETIKFSKTSFNISDDSKTSGTLNNDKLDFTITEWDKTVTTPDNYRSNYPYAFQFKGAITYSKGFHGESSQTGKGIADSDIKADGTGTECSMYVYFDYAGEDDITFVRTPFSKTSGGAAGDKTDIVKATSAADAAARVYTKVAE
jgi:hypothetical protein